ncbi:hypothetical protein [Nonomuraea bangladeshensis]
MPRRIATDAGLPAPVCRTLTPNGLRHSFITLALVAGATCATPSDCI